MNGTAASAGQDPSTVSRAAALVGDIAEDTGELLDGYLELARHDVREELRDAREYLRMVIVAGLCIAASAILVVTGACLALADLVGLPLWQSFTGIGLAGLGAAAVALAAARRQRDEVTAPKAVDEAKDDIEWIAKRT